VKLTDIAAVFIGAGIGGTLRFVLGGWMAERWGTSFPWHTLVINVSGAFLLGVLMAFAVDRGLVSPEVRIFFGVGVLGGFTTFSTLSYESIALIEEGLVLQGLANMFGSGILGMAAAVIGVFVGRTI
jgi:CrcB protein